MTRPRSAATRRRQLRDQRRAQQAADRDSYSDGVFGIDLRELAPGGGRSKMQLRWTIDPDPHVALMALERLHTGVLAGVEAFLVEQARDAGYSWDEIGWCLRLTGERVRQRHGIVSGQG